LPGTAPSDASAAGEIGRHHHLAQLLTGDAIATQREGNAVLVIVWP
jgi:hypothetical protein